MYCTEAQVRNSNKKFESTIDVTQVVILDRILCAEDIVKVALSPVISESDLNTIGSTSKVVNLLTIYKAVELTLVAYYGVSRKVDELTDVQYFQKQFNDLLKLVLNGDIEIIVGTTEYSPKGYPALDGGSNKKFYVRKGIDGFMAEGESSNYGSDTVDDAIKS